MIFKKPYAFLIKYFKVINFILSVLTIYIAYRTYRVISFFNDYVIHNYSGNFYEGFSNNYISPMLYIIIILILFGISGITLLFVYKKKPVKAYIVSIIYYIVIIIFFAFIKNIMITLETSIITAETSRIYRDLSVISIFPQIYFIILFLVRGFGFNLKKFEFDKDIKELEIKEQDNEEVEITFNNDNVKLKRNIRRFFREFTYYVKENKFIFTIIIIVLVVLILFLIYSLFPEIIDKNYKQGDIFVTNNLKYRIDDSIITNLDYNGNTFDNDVYYVVLKMYIENNNKEDVDIDYNNFRLVINNDRYIYPIIDKGKYFIDYAKEYYGNTIKKDSKITYSLIYQIKKDDIKSNYKIKIANGATFQDKILVGKYNYVTITPIVIDEIATEKTVNQNEEINFNNSNLGNTTLKVSNSEITDSYTYNYDYCINECTTYKNIINVDYKKNSKTLLVFDYEYNISEESSFYSYSKDISTFVNTFLKVKYKENDNFKYASVESVTPNNLKDKIVIETTNNIKETNELYLAIIIRNKEYLIKIK